MSFTHVVTSTVTIADLTYTWSNNQTADQVNNIDASIPDASTDLEVTWEADISAMKTFMMVADGVITVETNSGSSADDTFVLAAGEPIVWSTGQGLVNPLTADVVTNIFVTNASGGAVALKIRMLQDPTP